MKSLILAIGFLCTSPLLNAQVIPDLNGKTVHFDQQNVSNQDWNAFMKFIKNDGGFSKKYIASVTPDKWSSVSVDEKVQQHLAVTGVSWVQAQEYCKWRSELATYLNTHTEVTNYQQMMSDNKLAKTIFTYRLPTGVEFRKMVASKSKNSDDTGGFRCVYSVRNMAFSKSNS